METLGISPDALWAQRPGEWPAADAVYDADRADDGELLRARLRVIHAHHATPPRGDTDPIPPGRR